MRKLLITIGCLAFLFSMTHAWSKHPRHPKRKQTEIKTLTVAKKDKKTSQKPQNHKKDSVEPKPTKATDKKSKSAHVDSSAAKTAKFLAVKADPLPKSTVPVILDTPKKLVIPAVVKQPITAADNKIPTADLAAVASKISKTTMNPASQWMSVDMDWASLWHWSRTYSAKSTIDMTTPDSNHGDKSASICQLVAKHPDWYRAAKVTEAKWGVPVHVQFAIMRTESKFNPIAKNPSSTAFGFAQALSGTWHRYQSEEENRANRTNFSAASDFIGWYANHMQDELGIDSSDAYRLYLAYHDGGAAYKRQQRQGQFKIGKLAHHVQRDADNFADQLSMCTLV